MNFSLTHDQQEALSDLSSWFSLPHKPFITLGGYAGTGKTTLLAILRQKIHQQNANVKVAFCAFTGKAALVLSGKLEAQGSIYKGDRVSTIHSLIYEVKTDKKGKITGWKRKPELELDLIIIDEASMITETIWNDLLSFGIPIIAVGDHGQLPPINGNFNLMGEVDLYLEQIHRQARTSPIITLSQYARQDGHIPVGFYSKEVVKHYRADPDINNTIQSLLESWNQESLFLVGINATRLKLNQQIRSLRGFESMSPTLGDRVICLKNNWEAGIYNGMIGTVNSLDIKEDRNGVAQWYEADIEMDDGTSFIGKICLHQFNQPNALTEIDGLAYSEIGDLFDFGYALTVHKAQGSQARRVVIFEERTKYMDDEAWRRWLYTAVTRAQKELILIGE